ncbi:hypothetical protein F1880_002342 [Penicillium rolfsii]|nr:hypothetical protein F1880_002342 [Penicillium rolfsii]
MDHLPGMLTKISASLTNPQPTLHLTITSILTTFPEPLQTILTNATYTYLRSTAHSQITTHLTTLRTTFVTPYILTPLSHLLATTLGATAAMPDLMGALVLAALLVVSLIILDYMRRFVVWWVMWWVRFIMRVVFWGTVVLVGVYVWNVGGEQAIRDVGRIGGFVMGFVEEGLGSLDSGNGRGGKGKGSSNAWW